MNDVKIYMHANTSWPTVINYQVETVKAYYEISILIC